MNARRTNGGEEADFASKSVAMATSLTDRKKKVGSFIYHQIKYLPLGENRPSRLDSAIICLQADN